MLDRPPRAVPPIKTVPRPLGNFDLFVSTYYTSPTIRGLASVVVVHDLIYERWPHLPARVGDGLTLARKRHCIECAAAIVTPSRATAEQLPAFYEDLQAHVSVIRHGVEPAFAEEGGRVNRGAQDLLETAGVHGPFALHVGGRSNYKNFSAVQRAFADRDLRSSLSLVTVGSEPRPLPDELESSFLPRPIHLGPVTQEIVAALIAKAAVVVSASRAEGFGLPVAEACVAGTPVACSDIPAYREIVGGWAEFFDPDDAAATIRAIRRAAAKPRNTLSGPDQFSWDEAAARFADTLRSVADEGK